jgi:ankyrin repeat protein
MVNILCLYIQNRNTEKAIEIIKNPNTDVNAGVHSTTPLMMACSDKSGNIEIVKELLKRDDILVNLQDRDGRTALMECINIKYDRDTHLHTHYLRNFEILKELLERDELDVNLQDSEGETVLYMLARVNGCEYIEELFKRDDVDKSIREYCNYGDGGRLTALQIAKVFEKDSAVKLIKNYNP